MSRSQSRYVFNPAKSHPRTPEGIARKEAWLNAEAARAARAHAAKSGWPPTESAVHFGLRVNSGRYGLRLARDSYALINKRASIRMDPELYPDLWEAVHDRFEDECHKFYTDEWCIEQRARALENFDLNIRYFASLDHAEFDSALREVVATELDMVEVTDLSEWDGVPGLYIMVLDGYSQAYVGMTESAGGVKARVRGHWAGTKAFDRLLWGGVHESILSIDSFRALDTTRIFALRADDPFPLEGRVVEAFPNRFLLNRVMGGRPEMLGLLLRAGVDVMKRRGLAQRVPSPR